MAFQSQFHSFVCLFVCERINQNKNLLHLCVVACASKNYCNVQRKSLSRFLNVSLFICSTFFLEDIFSVFRLFHHHFTHFSLLLFYIHMSFHHRLLFLYALRYFAMFFHYLFYFIIVCFFDVRLVPYFCVTSLETRLVENSLSVVTYFKAFSESLLTYLWQFFQLVEPELHLLLPGNIKVIRRIWSTN